MSAEDSPLGSITTVADSRVISSTVTVHGTSLPRLSRIIMPSAPNSSPTEKASLADPVSLPLCSPSSPSASMILTQAFSGSVLTRLSGALPLLSSECSTMMPWPGSAESNPESPLRVIHMVSPGAISMARLIPPSDIGPTTKLPPMSLSTTVERLAPIKSRVAAPGIEGTAPLPFQLPLAMMSQSPKPFQFEEGKSLCTS